MEKIWNWTQIAFASVGGILGWLVGAGSPGGRLDGLIYALISLMAFDYISGIMCACVEKTLSSEVGFRGIFKKVLILCLVAVGNLMDVHVIGTGAVLRSAIIFFYIANEGLSLLENTTRLGLPVPQKLKDVLVQLHGKSESQSTANPSEEERDPIVAPPHPQAETPTENNNNKTEDNDNESA
jgi:toxin secretion/phage lysis holin